MVQKIDNGWIVGYCGELGFGYSFSRLDIKHYKENYIGISMFSSGNDILDHLLQKEAHRHDECVTYVFYSDADEKSIPVAFCSLCASSFGMMEYIDGKDRCVAQPAIEFRYFAVRKNCQKKQIPEIGVTISSFIFSKCMEYAAYAAKNVIGAEYFLLHSVNKQNVRNFYKKHGFVEFSSEQIDFESYNLKGHIPALFQISQPK